jgi:O-acetyl-ADP-ribose deacetylase (regulator of RNase III)
MIRLIAGDLTTFDGDAIVNPANNAGLGGGGADGAIHRAAGPGLLAACLTLPFTEGEGYGPGLKPITNIRVPNGGAIPTPAFDLPCRWVIHTAGPVWPSDPDAKLYIVNNPPSALAGMQMKLGCKGTSRDTIARATLRDCYKMPFVTAAGMGCKSIAFPAISTGVYGCPVETCAEVALIFARQHRDWPLDVTFYLYPAEHLDTWLKVAEGLGVYIEIED